MPKLAVFFLTIYAVTVASIFFKFPADEAAVRAVILAVAYVLAYVVCRLVALAAGKLWRIGR